MSDPAIRVIGFLTSSSSTLTILKRDRPRPSRSQSSKTSTSPPSGPGSGWEKSERRSAQSGSRIASARSIDSRLDSPTCQVEIPSLRNTTSPLPSITKIPSATRISMSVSPCSLFISTDIPRDEESATPYGVRLQGSSRRVDVSIHHSTPPTVAFGHGLLFGDGSGSEFPERRQTVRGD